MSAGTKRVAIVRRRRLIRQHCAYKCPKDQTMVATQGSLVRGSAGSLCTNLFKTHELQPINAHLPSKAVRTSSAAAHSLPSLSSCTLGTKSTVGFRSRNNLGRGHGSVVTRVSTGNEVKELVLMEVRAGVLFKVIRRTTGNHTGSYKF